MVKVKNIKVYQIYYDQASKEKLDPNFIALDNSSNQRPDWCEYWPIRNVLLNEHFEADTYIGFFSPKFYEKTLLDAKQVSLILNSSNADVVSFSPYFDQMAIYLNPFFQGEAYHPGLMMVTKALMKYLDIDIDIKLLVSDQTTTIFSNYFVAKYEFWLIWFSYAEKIFHLCESEKSGLANILISNTNHEGKHAIPMKAFVMERLITLVLEQLQISAQIGTNIKTVAYIVNNSTKTDKFFNELIICDALKGQFRKTKLPAYLNAYIDYKSAVWN